MLDLVAYFALVMSGLNWLFFLAMTIHDERRKPPPPPAKGLGHTEAHAIDPSKLAGATGTLAGAFKKAGAAPTAAAMSVLCLLVALIAGGVGKL